MKKVINTDREVIFMINNNALFYTCSLIEYISRQQKQKRSDIVHMLGKETIKRIYTHADVFHCEPIEKTADDFITRKNIPVGTFDNIMDCSGEIPDYWTVGEMHAREIENIVSDREISIEDAIMEVYKEESESE